MRFRNERGGGCGEPALSGMLDTPRNWLEVVEQIGVLEELIAESRGTDEGSDGFVLVELERLLAGRRASLRARPGAGAR